MITISAAIERATWDEDDERCYIRRRCDIFLHPTPCPFAGFSRFIRALVAQINARCSGEP